VSVKKVLIEFLVGIKIQLKEVLFSGHSVSGFNIIFVSCKIIINFLQPVCSVIVEASRERSVFTYIFLYIYVYIIATKQAIQKCLLKNAREFAVYKKFPLLVHCLLSVNYRTLKITLFGCYLTS